MPTRKEDNTGYHLGNAQRHLADLVELPTV